MLGCLPTPLTLGPRGPSCAHTVTWYAQGAHSTMKNLRSSLMQRPPSSQVSDGLSTAGLRLL